MSLREKHKRERRERILDAARRLVRSTGGTDFSMQTLAGEAEVSLVTPYNLFGSKSGVLYALLNDSLEGLGRVADSELSSKAVDAVLDLAGIAADEYARDATFYRPLMQFLLGVRDLEHRPRLMEQSLRRWSRTVEAAIAGGLLPADIEKSLLVRQLLVTFLGALELWVHEELDDEAFRAQSLYGSALLVLAHASAASRPRLLQRLRGIERKLSRPAARSGRKRGDKRRSAA